MHICDKALPCRTSKERQGDQRPWHGVRADTPCRRKRAQARDCKEEVHADVSETKRNTSTCKLKASKVAMIM